MPEIAGELPPERREPEPQQGEPERQPMHQPAERRMVKIGLNADVVALARMNYGGPNGEFRVALDRAIDEHLATVNSLLEQAGFEAEANGNIRIWPVSLDNLNRLDAVARSRGLPRTEIIRCLIVLAARAGAAEEQAVAGNQVVPDKPDDPFAIKRHSISAN